MIADGSGHGSFLASATVGKCERTADLGHLYWPKPCNAFGKENFLDCFGVICIQHAVARHPVFGSQLDLGRKVADSCGGEHDEDFAEIANCPWRVTTSAGLGLLSGGSYHQTSPRFTMACAQLPAPARPASALS
jgi:hypothetical protein